MKYIKNFFAFVLIFPFATACSHGYKQEKQTAFQTNNKKTYSLAANIRPKPLVVIDAGHGGFDIGAQTESCQEKSLALITAEHIKKHLNERGYPVLLTRTRDIFIPLKDRVQAANAAKGAIFVSVHFNAAKNESANGVEVYYFEKGKKIRSGLSKKLAQRVLASLLYRTGASSRGIKSGNFFVIRETKMPAILIEGGFITHNQEGKLLIDEKYQEKISIAVAEGIDKYFR